LGGRWAKLAVSAFAKGLLDFSKITRDTSRSISKETLVLRELEDERYSEMFSLRAVLTALVPGDNGAASQANLSEFINIKFPWVKANNKDVSQDEVSKLVESLKQYKESQANGSTTNATVDAAPE